MNTSDIDIDIVVVGPPGNEHEDRRDGSPCSRCGFVFRSMPAWVREAIGLRELAVAEREGSPRAARPIRFEIRGSVLVSVSLVSRTNRRTPGNMHFEDVVLACEEDPETGDVRWSPPPEGSSIGTLRESFGRGSRGLFGEDLVRRFYVEDMEEARELCLHPAKLLAKGAP